ARRGGAQPDPADRHHVGDGRVPARVLDRRRGGPEQQGRRGAAVRGGRAAQAVRRGDDHEGPAVRAGRARGQHRRHPHRAGAADRAAARRAGAADARSQPDCGRDRRRVARDHGAGRQDAALRGREEGDGHLYRGRLREDLAGRPAQGRARHGRGRRVGLAPPIATQIERLPEPTISKPGDPMDAETTQDQQALRAQLAEAKQRLDGLVRDLRAIDGELEELSTERRQHQLLREACGALGQLAQIGGAALVWGDRTAAGAGEQQLSRALSLVEGFEKRIGEIEERRQEVLERVLQQQDDTDWLEGDVLEAEDEARQRELEWIVEREASEVPARVLVMPWSRRSEEDYRFRKDLLSTLAATLLLALVIPRIEIPLLQPHRAPAPPDRGVRLVPQQRPRPPRAPEPKPELAEQKPQPAEKLVPENAKPREGPGKGKTEGPGVGPAKGLLAFREQLAGIKVNQQLARLGADAHVTNAGAASGAVQRSMVTTSAPGSSAGINPAATSRGANGRANGRRRR